MVSLESHKLIHWTIFLMNILKLTLLSQEKKGENLSAKYIQIVHKPYTKDHYRVIKACFKASPLLYS